MSLAICLQAAAVVFNVQVMLRPAVPGQSPLLFESRGLHGPDMKKRFKASETLEQRCKFMKMVF